MHCLSTWESVGLALLGMFFLLLCVFIAAALAYGRGKSNGYAQARARYVAVLNEQAQAWGSPSSLHGRKF